jgi:hypothetical protein
MAPPYQASVSGVDVTARFQNALAVGNFEFEKG